MLNLLDDTANTVPLQPDGFIDAVALGRDIFAPRPIPPVDLSVAAPTGDADEARELAADLHITRDLLFVALAEVVILTTRLQAATVTIASQRDEMRRYTASVVTGRAA